MVEVTKYESSTSKIRWLKFAFKNKSQIAKSRSNNKFSRSWTKWQQRAEKNGDYEGNKIEAKVKVKVEGTIEEICFKQKSEVREKEIVLARAYFCTWSSESGFGVEQSARCYNQSFNRSK